MAEIREREEILYGYMESVAELLTLPDTKLGEYIGEARRGTLNVAKKKVLLRHDTKTIFDFCLEVAQAPGKKTELHEDFAVLSEIECHGPNMLGICLTLTEAALQQPT